MVKTKKQQFFHIYAICANMHFISSELRDVNEGGTYADNCAFGWYYNPTFTLTQPAAPSCSGTSSGPVNLTWTQSAGAQSYTVQRRLLNPPGSFEPLQTLPAESLGNPVLNYPDTTVQTGSTYEYQIMATNPSGATLSNIKSVITPSCTPPTITSLEIKNVGSRTFNGSNVSGRQNTQQGSDWFNPIQITLTAERGSSDIKESYVTFTPGFQVAYTPDAGRLDTCVNYCVYDNVNNVWKDIPATVGYPICANGDCVNQTLLTILRGTTANSWVIQFDKNFGSQPNIPITAKVVDQNGLSTSQLNCETTNQPGQCQLIINRNTIP